MTLDQLPLQTPARITAVTWSNLANDEAARLKALGFEEGAEVSLGYRGIFGGRDPLAVEIGRMTVALRLNHARAMIVELLR